MTAIVQTRVVGLLITGGDSTGVPWWGVIAVPLMFALVPALLAIAPNLVGRFISRRRSRD